MTILELIDASATQLDAAGVSFGHGTSNAYDEAAWLVLWKLGLPLHSQLNGPDSIADTELSDAQQAAVRSLVAERIVSRRPAAYLTREAWLQGVPFYADQRAIVPRSLIAELLVCDALDYWLPHGPARVLDLCTGGGSLAVLAAQIWPTAKVDASDLSAEALAVAAINRDRHGLADHICLLQGDGLSTALGRYDLILCNPPYVNAHSMRSLPPEYRAEPELALAGGVDGMDFVRKLIFGASSHLYEQALLVLEIGHERAHFDAAFATLDAVWLDTSAGTDQVCAITSAALRAFSTVDVSGHPQPQTP